MRRGSGRSADNDLIGARNSDAARSRGGDIAAGGGFGTAATTANESQRNHGDEQHRGKYRIARQRKSANTEFLPPEQWQQREQPESDRRLSQHGGNRVWPERRFRSGAQWRHQSRLRSVGGEQEIERLRGRDGSWIRLRVENASAGRHRTGGEEGHLDRGSGRRRNGDGEFSGLAVGHNDGSAGGSNGEVPGANSGARERYRLCPGRGVVGKRKSRSALAESRGSERQNDGARISGGNNALRAAG